MGLTKIMPSDFKFSQRSLDNLKGVHPDLVQVMTRTLQLSSVDFGITEGVRTRERQKILFAEKKSQTLNSRHIPGADGFGKAVDVAAYVNGKLTWNYAEYVKIAGFVKTAAKELKIPITWGGDFVTFKDGVHFELSRKEYP